MEGALHNHDALHVLKHAQVASRKLDSMKALLWIACTGCGFSPSAASDAAALDDSGHLIIDAPSEGLAHCDVGPMGTTATASGQLGNPGSGVQQPDLICAAGELLIGFQFEMTTANPPGGWNQHVAMATHARCGTIALAPDGQMHTAIAESSASVAPQCTSWPPSMISKETLCPDGNVLVGLSGNEASRGSTHSLFNSVTLVCAPLDFHGAPTEPTSRNQMVDTGMNMDQPQSVTCDPGSVVVATNIYTACGQDGLRLQCAPSACM